MRSENTITEEDEMAKTPIARLKKILLVRNDRIGDLVLTLPAFQAVRRQWPRARVAALVSPYTAPLLSGTGYVDEVILDDTADGPQDLARRLKPHEFEAVLVFNSNTRNCRAMWHAGVPRRVCWAYKPAGMLLGNLRVRVHRTHPPIHEAEFALAFVRRLGGAAVMANLSPHLHVDAHTRERIAARIQRELGSNGPLFGVHPGNGASAFNWPMEHYVELIHRLAGHGRVMITGSAAERPMLAAIRAGVCDTAANRVGYFSDFDLGELAAALSLVSSFTASSTGPMHMAGILETPVVALFSPHPVHAPAKWAPLGRKHALLVAPLEPSEDPRIPRERGEAVMSRIAVADVLAANLMNAQSWPAADGVERWSRAS
ncbi:MAG: glycosyltransferase family 9 protein [Pirellulales bacterium]